MKIAIYGAGALGGYFGGRLQQAGHSVFYIARGAHLAALQTNGLTIKSQLGDAALAVNATEDPATIGEVDFVFFLVKLQDTEDAARKLAPMIGPATSVVTFQNGVDGASMIGGIIGPERVISGSAYISAEVAEPGVIQHNSVFASLVYGELDGSKSGRVNALDAALKSAGIESKPVDNIQVRLWHKFVFLSSLSAITALTRLSIGQVLGDTHTRELYISALNEAAQVGLKVCPGLPENVATTQLELSESLPYGMRASMLDDLERGKPLELEYLSGAIVRLGDEQGIEVPVHRMVFQALHFYRHGHASPKDTNLN